MVKIKDFALVFEKGGKPISHIHKPSMRRAVRARELPVQWAQFKLIKLN